MTDKKLNNIDEHPHFRHKEEFREKTKSQVEIGADAEKTSDFYRTNNLPMRFETPVCFHGYGQPELQNPLYRTTSSEYGRTSPHICFQGYGNPKQQNPMYRTTSAEYGGTNPTVHTVPTSFYPRCRKFSDHLGVCGMYRNRSLNTSMDKSYV